MHRAQLFVTCMVDLFRPRVGVGAVRLLERRGVTVEFPERQTCCGQFAYSAGHHREAAAMGRGFVRAFETAKATTAADADVGAAAAVPVIALSGSCAAMVTHEMPELLERDALERGWSRTSAERWRRRAEALAGRVVELSAWLDREQARTAGAETATPPEADGGAHPSVACHTGCHMRRLLGVTEAPLNVLRAAGAAPHELPDADQCCGFGGTFALGEPELSAAMADAKLEALAALRREGAACLVSADLGCLLQLEGRLHRQGDAYPVLHLAELVDLADQGRLTPDGLAGASRLQQGGA